MIAKKGSRRVTVDGVAYRWVYPRKPTKAQRDGGSIRIPVCAEAGGATLLVELDSPHSKNCVQRYGLSITPGAVAAWVRQARGEGWVPGRSGPQHRMRGVHSLQRAATAEHPPISRDEAETMGSGPYNRLTIIRDGRWWSPAIDGEPFLELVRIAEEAHVRREILERGPDATGLAPGDYGPGWVLGRDAFLGQPQTPRFAFDEGDPRLSKTEVMDCTCGCSGCWPLMANIYNFPTRVVWANFEQVHRDWILDLGPFVFRRSQYEESFEAVF